MYTDTPCTHPHTTQVHVHRHKHTMHMLTDTPCTYPHGTHVDIHTTQAFIYTSTHTYHRLFYTYSLYLTYSTHTPSYACTRVHSYTLTYTALFSDSLKGCDCSGKALVTVVLAEPVSVPFTGVGHQGISRADKLTRQHLGQSVGKTGVLLENMCHIPKLNSCSRSLSP